MHGILDQLHLLQHEDVKLAPGALLFLLGAPEPFTLFPWLAKLGNDAGLQFSEIFVDHAVLVRMFEVESGEVFSPYPYR